MSFSFLTHHFSKLLRTKDRCVCIGYQMYNHIHVALNSTKTASFFRQIEMTYPRSYVLSKDVMTCMYFRLPSRRSNAWTYRTQRFGSSKPLCTSHKRGCMRRHIQHMPGCGLSLEIQSVIIYKRFTIEKYENFITWEKKLVIKMTKKHLESKDFVYE